MKMIAAGHEDHFVRFFDPNSSISTIIKIKSSKNLLLTQMESQECNLEKKVLNFLALVTMEV